MRQLLWSQKITIKTEFDLESRGGKMNYYLFGNSILTEGQMHVVWMENYMAENKNFQKWLQTQQRAS